MTRRKGRRVQFLPTVVADLDAVFRLPILRLQLIDEAVCDPHASGTGAPGREESFKGLLRSLARDLTVDEKALEDYMRAEVREWLQGFPERQLLTALYGRAARREARRGSPDGRRRPSHQEGLRIARALLADVPDTGQFDSEWESAAVPTVLAALWLPPISVRSTDKLREYIERSEASRVYFDALKHIFEELDNGNQAISRPLATWQAQAASGRRRRPNRISRPANRPVDLATLLRDFQIQFTILILLRIGVQPRGNPVSGCRIVSEALTLSEHTVERIRKERIWRRSFGLQMQKHSKAIAMRTGPVTIPYR